MAQSPSGAGALALNGAASTASPTTIATSQAGVAATPLTINGVYRQTRYTAPTMGLTGASIASLPSVQPIYITSAGNDAAITFAVVGLDRRGGVLSETIRGTNASVAASANSYKTIVSITPSGNTASTVTVGNMGVATLDTSRRVIFTSSGNDSGLTISIAGTDWSGIPISETVTGANAGAVSTILDYLTVTGVTVSGASAGTISVGTSGVAGSQWVLLDSFSSGTASIQCVVSGTINYTVQTTNDDPTSYANPVARAAVTWDATNGGLIAQTTSGSYNFSEIPTWMRVVANSQTNPGSVRMTIVQHLAAPY